MNEIVRALRTIGPARTGRLVEVLTESLKISAAAARQRLSRARSPIERYPRGLLPKREDFLYLKDQYRSELYWDHLLRDLRDQGAVLGCAIDGLEARGGIVPVDEFAVVSGAPIALKKQVSSEHTADRLKTLGVMEERRLNGLGHCFVARPNAVIQPLTVGHIRARHITESIMLDGLAQWIRKNGIGSYHKVSIRGDGQPRRVGPFKWDLTGPSYVRPVRRAKVKHGFVVADVFSQERLDVPHIQYMIRKVEIYERAANSGVLFPILMADSFTDKAITNGHAAGLMLTTPRDLFGRSVARALTDLTQTLRNAATAVSGDSDRLYDLLDKLSEIEGRAGNMRGVLFELIAAYIAKREFGGRIELGVTHTHRHTGKTAELDIVCESDPQRVYVIECKGKIPGGEVLLAEVTDWLSKLPIVQDYVASREQLRERTQICELWTTGTFADDALARLSDEQAHRTRRPIAWRDGAAVRGAATKLGLKAIKSALDQHYLRHPSTKFRS